MMFQGLPEFALCPPPRGRPNANLANHVLKSRALDSRYFVWMKVKGPHNYMVTTPWLVCEVALSNMPTIFYFTTTITTTYPNIP
jgi:hypothetical protein